MVNETDLIYVIPREIIDSIPFISTIVKTVGVFAVVYLIYLIIKLYFDKNRKDELRKINENLKKIISILEKSHKKK